MTVCVIAANYSMHCLLDDLGSRMTLQQKDMHIPPFNHSIMQTAPMRENSDGTKRHVCSSALSSIRPPPPALQHQSQPTCPVRTDLKWDYNHQNNSGEQFHPEHNSSCYFKFIGHFLFCHFLL